MNRRIAAMVLLCASTSYAAAEDPASAAGAPPAAGGAAHAPPNPAAVVDGKAAMDLFLDRLMMAESGGRDGARNPRSTALGPFQFIESTFLEVVARHFAAETAKLETPAVLALRTDRAFARRAAEAFTRDNAALLVAAGLPASYANLRLAFFAGAEGAIRVLKADPATPVRQLLGAAAIGANAFLARMTAGDVVAWSARNLAASRLSSEAVTADLSRLSKAGRARKATVAARCNRRLVSCRRWIALATRRIDRRQAASLPKRTPNAPAVLRRSSLRN
jgi:hypothetical protein